MRLGAVSSSVHKAAFWQDLVQFNYMYALSFTLFAFNQDEMHIRLETIFPWFAKETYFGPVYK